MATYQMGILKLKVEQGVTEKWNEHEALHLNVEAENKSWLE
jgi:hypothetical protein